MMGLKIVCTLLSLVAALSLRADDRSAGLLGALGERLAGYASYEVAFTAGMSGEFENVSGRLVVSGDRYWIGVGDTELFSDGKARYTYNKTNHEVVIEEPDASDNGFLSNPARFFRMYDTDFTHSLIGSAVVSGRTVQRVRLIPRNEDAGYASIELSIDASTGMPVEIVYSDGSSPDVRIRIDGIVPGPEVPSGRFSFDREKYGDAEVIDFRR